MDQLRRLARAASESAVTFRGLTGSDRAMLYSVAASTGFRAGELASLTTAAFDPAADPPTVTLAAEHAKNGNPAVQPLPPELAETLSGYLRAEVQTGWCGPGRGSGRRPR